MRWVAALGVLALTAAPGTLTLPAPAAPVPPTLIADVFSDRPDRAKVSKLPGPVDDVERVEVLVGPDGVPAAVTMDQRLALHGTGGFVVYERATALDAEALDDTVEPVLKREAVIWQGFVNGTKDVHARLTLDPAVEARLLPFTVSISGTRVRLSNTTTRTLTLPTGDVPANDVAGPLDALVTASKRPGAPPAAGRGLPTTLTGDLGPTRVASVAAPLRVTGTITGARYTGATSQAVSATANGVALDGVLQGDLDLTFDGGPIVLDLTAVPTVDPRGLTPPRGRTWAQWATMSPTVAERRAAVDALVTAAAESARDDDFAPYLGHHGPGTVMTSFHVAMAPPELVAKARRPLRPKPFPLALLGLALVATTGGGYAVWRRL
jgi:hypothetical protein